MKTFKRICIKNWEIIAQNGDRFRVERGKEYLTSKKLKYCSGCREDFYNGNNDMGIKECWHLKSAKLVLKKEVHIDQRPPWKQKPRRFLSCYKRPRHIYVGPNEEY